MAEWNGEPAGFALFYFGFSTWTGGPMLYLEDLFVRPAHRKKRIGLALMQRLAREALDHGCHRFVWQVLDWNEPAIRFYESLGAKVLKEWETVRIDGEALARKLADSRGRRPRIGTKPRRLASERPSARRIRAVGSQLSAPQNVCSGAPQESPAARRHNTAPPRRAGAASLYFLPAGAGGGELAPVLPTFPFLSPEWPWNVRVGANSPSLCPTMFSVTNTGTNFRPLCTAKVSPTESGVIVLRRDHVLTRTFLLCAAPAAAIFSAR